VVLEDAQKPINITIYAAAITRPSHDARIAMTSTVSKQLLSVFVVHNEPPYCLPDSSQIKLLERVLVYQTIIFQNY
jgi:hypothetical protein